MWGGGYLYDFDFDGAPELADEEYGLICEFCIYKIVDNKSELLGSIENGSIKPEWVTIPEITLYYDEKNNEYFYVSNMICGKRKLIMQK